jgi:hypothetical protein
MKKIPRRYIDLVIDEIGLYDERVLDFDASNHFDEDITMIIQEGKEIWVEHDPFQGKVYDYDFSIAYKLWEWAEHEINKRDEELSKSTREEELLTAATVGILRALEEFKLADRFEIWAASTDRTFREKIYLNHVQTWRKTDPEIQSLLEFLDLTQKDIDRIWELARSYNF